MSGEPVRLFVGGLPSTVSHTQISQRFESFGEVHGVEPVPEKEGTVHASRPLQPCRGFAYVLLTPNDEASLRRCISMVCLRSLAVRAATVLPFPYAKRDLQRVRAAQYHRHGLVQYNGCKWLGGVLRVEPAKPDYRQRLAKEAAQAQAQELDPELSEASQPLDMPHRSGPVHLASRDGRKVSLDLLAASCLMSTLPPTVWDACKSTNGPSWKSPGQGSQLTYRGGNPLAGACSGAQPCEDILPSYAPHAY